MKQKRRGFTLIELLAVIVILAIIALIAVPVIMNIITSARKSAFEDTAYGLISAGEMYYAQALLENGMTSDVEFTIEDGEFVGENKLEVKGALPTNGKITITKDGRVAIAVNNGAHCVTKATSESKITTVKYAGSCEYKMVLNPIIISRKTCLTDGSECVVGTKLTVQVNTTDTQGFYVVSDIDNVLTLLMDKNIGETVAWITQDDYEAAGGTAWDDWIDNNTFGPITALNYLESQTSGWTNIAAQTFTLTDNVYGTITRPNARARMLTKIEANSIISNSWSYGNFVISTEGYWTSSAYASGVKYAWLVYRGGSIFSSHVSNGSDYYGVRPVIEIPKFFI